MPAAAVLFCRVSTQKQAARNESNLPTQQKRCEDWCKSESLPVIRVFVAEGESAWDTDRPVSLKEPGLGEASLIASQGGTIDARRHIRRGGTLKVSIAYFPESYGERVLKLAIKILEGEHPPLTNHTEHVVLTADNISEFYNEKHDLKRSPK